MQLSDIKECDLFQFKAPASNKLLIKIAQACYPFLMNLKYGSFTVEGKEGLEAIKRLQTTRMIICPNHPSHMDADVAFYISRIFDEPMYFLTAREVFRSSANEHLLPLAGCFSVTRGANDFNSFKESVHILVEGRGKLLIFPEGEISGRNDLLLPLKLGPAHIACSALDHLRMKSINQPLYIVPTALKYLYPGDHRLLLDAQMEEIETKLGLPATRRGADSPIEERLMQAVLLVLDDILGKYGCRTDSAQSFAQRIRTARLLILTHIAAYLDIRFDEQEVTELELAHQIYVRLYESRCYEEQLEWILDFERHHERHRLLNEYIHDLHRVVNFISFEKEPHVLDQDALVNSVSILTAEVLERNLRLPVHAKITFGRPIDIRTIYDGNRSHKAGSILALTSLLESELSQLLGISPRTFQGNVEIKQTH